ncbi:MAG: dolichol kinase [Methanocellales archaeon]|nr:dolichol kinase [Methanocellales archaeon]
MPKPIEILKKEVMRKTIHIAGAAVPVSYLFIDRSLMLAGLSALVMSAIVMEWARLNGRIKLADLIRQEEGKRVAAYVYFAVASLATVFLFPKMVAIVALLMLCIGDSLLGLFGVLLLLFRRSGRADVRTKRFGGGGIIRDVKESISAAKDAELMLLMLLICFLIGALLIPPYVAFMGAIGAMLADAIPWQVGGRVLDDNLTVPIFASVLMTIASPF